MPVVFRQSGLRYYFFSNEPVGWVEHLRYPSVAICEDDGFREGLNPSYGLVLGHSHDYVCLNFCSA
jgi:hypothetical protein